MIHATFTQDAQKGSVTMEMQGHALTAPKGQDLICAAATMLVYTLGQAVQFLYEQGRLLYEPQMRMVDGYAKITVYPRKCAVAETLMAFWVAQAGAYVLERNYPKAVDLMDFNGKSALVEKVRQNGGRYQAELARPQVEPMAEGEMRIRSGDNASPV